MFLLFCLGLGLAGIGLFFTFTEQDGMKKVSQIFFGISLILSGFLLFELKYNRNNPHEMLIALTVIGLILGIFFWFGDDIKSQNVGIVENKKEQPPLSTTSPSTIENNHIPKNHISVEQFCKEHKLKENDVINKIKSYNYAGEEVDNKWYVNKFEK